MEKILSVVLLIIGILLGYLFAERCFVDQKSENFYHRAVTVDTTIYRDIPPVEVRHIAPKSTTTEINSRKSVGNFEHSDSVNTPQPPLLEYHFRDTLQGGWSAVVQGRDVKLREMMVTSKSLTTTEFRDPKWSVALVGEISPDAMWAGVEVTRAIRKNLALSLTAGYDPIHRSIHTQLGARLTIWRE